MFLFNGDECIRWDTPKKQWTTCDFINEEKTYESCSFVPVDPFLLKKDTKPPFNVVSTGGVEPGTGLISN